MPVVKLEEAENAEWAILDPDTIIEVEVEDITTRDVPGKDGKSGWSKFEFKFIIKGVPTHAEEEFGSLVGTRIWGSVGTRFSTHPDNKLRQWAVALLNMGDFPPGFELDTDMLIGRTARGVVRQYQKRDGSYNHQIGALLPPVTATSAPADPWSTLAIAPATSTFTPAPPAQASFFPDDAPF